jgi:hypothetical protein
MNPSLLNTYPFCCKAGAFTSPSSTIIRSSEISPAYIRSKLPAEWPTPLDSTVFEPSSWLWVWAPSPSLLGGWRKSKGFAFHSDWPKQQSSCGRVAYCVPHALLVESLLARWNSQRHLSQNCSIF